MYVLEINPAGLNKFWLTFIPDQVPVVFCTIDIRLNGLLVTHILGTTPVNEAVLYVDG